jgi:hypothetical protein
MTATPNVYAKARSETAELLNYDLACLTPDQSLRLDCAVALRLALDDLQGRIVRGESIDVNRMLTAAEALAKLLPAAVLASPPPEHRIDPREVMWQTYLGMRRRGELGERAAEPSLRQKIAELEAEIAALKAAGATVQHPAALPLPDAKVITPPTSDIVPPGEIGETFVGLQRGPDDPPAKSTQVIDGKAEQPPRPLRIGEQWDPVRGFRPIPPQPNAVPASTAPPPPAPPAPAYDYNVEQGWRDYVLPDSSITPFPVSGNRRWWGPV